MIQPERSEMQDMMEAGIGIAILLIVVTYFSFQLGVITFDEPAKINITPNVTEIITEVPTEEPTPIPTIDEKEFMLSHNGYELREWVHWFRADVEGIGNATGTRQDTGDLSTYVTVWGYKFMPSYHYYSVSWGRNFLEKPDYKDDQFLFIYVNSYSDGDDVRQYGIDYNHFSLQIGDRMYYPDFFDSPEQRIVEFDDIQNYGRTESIFPYGYRRHQEKGTGIITAEKLEWLMGGRSNAWDGYIQFQVPYGTKPEDVHVIGSFANLAPTAYWQLR
jgi:hypothetical protein